jgi:cystathionine beta-lyase/cystathionine gamma-synthase
VVGGALVSAAAELDAKLHYVTNACGLTESPWDAWLVLRGVRTLPQRMEAHAANALRLAQYLQGHPKVRAVHYPGLPDHPQRELAERQMTGSGGVVTFEVEAGREGLDRIFSRLRLYSLAESLGGVESLIESPWFMSHLSMAEEARARAGIHHGTVRVSVGLEHADDLIADLDAGLAAL